MAEQTLRIGFVGAGAIVRRRHVPGLRKIEGVELAAVANRRPESTAAFAEDFGIRQTFDDWRELVNWDGLDIVWCGTHPNLHREVTEAALAAGKHVFCQARMALDYADAKAMYEAARRSDRTTMLCPPPHYMRGDRIIQHLLREGFVGRPHNVVITSFNDRFFDPDAPLHWRQVRAVSGYNALDLGMMIEVQQRWLGYARRVCALEKTFMLEKPDPAGGFGPVERPDTLTAAAELENGALASFVISGVARQGAQANSFQIFGSHGTIRYLLDSDRILVGRADSGDLAEVPITPGEERPWTVEADFIAAVRASRPSGSPSFWDGLKYMELTEAIARSAESGQVVELPFEQLSPPDPA